MSFNLIFFKLNIAIHCVLEGGKVFMGKIFNFVREHTHTQRYLHFSK